MGKSELEGRFLLAWRGLAPEGAPEPVREYRFHPDRRWRFDFAWPAQQVAVAIDGGQWAPHGGRHSRDGDREKLNEAVLLGWCVLRYSGAMLDDPQGVVNEVCEALGL